MSILEFKTRYEIGQAFEDRVRKQYPFLKKYANDTSSNYIKQSEMERRKPDFWFQSTEGYGYYCEMKQGTINRRRWEYYAPDLLIFFQFNGEIHCSFKQDIVLTDWQDSRYDNSQYAYIKSWQEVHFNYKGGDKHVSS